MEVYKKAQILPLPSVCLTWTPETSGQQLFYLRMLETKIKMKQCLWQYTAVATKIRPYIYSDCIILYRQTNGTL